MILGGCETCDLVDALGEHLEELFGYEGKVLVEILLDNEFFFSNFLVDVIMSEF